MIIGKGIRLFETFFSRFLIKLKPKIRLGKDSIVINKSSWKLFTPDRFPSREYQITDTPLELISPKDYDYIIAYVGSIEKNELQAMPRLKWLQIPSHGSNGFDDCKLYANRNVVVTRTANVFADPIAQYCIAAYYVFNTFSFRSLITPPPRRGLKSIEITGCKSIQRVTIAILGLGNIGIELAKKCHDINWTVYGVKRQIPEEKPEFIDFIYTIDEMKKKLCVIDYVVNVLPETPETRGIYDYSFFKLFKKDAIFCNVGRASAVVEEDLRRALDDGIIRGAILDVSCSLETGKNIIVTHHSSFKSDTNDSLYDLYFFRQLSLFLKGETPEYQVELIN